jgi:tRNA U34 5-methylaminomethyl-2-thiouridine-forming methyltransferase MnmC
MPLRSSLKNNHVREIIVTKDGSHSLLHKELNETYHSVHGAIQESKYVFIEKGLQHWLDLNDHRNASILEIGFGTGLNALLTLLEATSRQNKISYATIEAHPLAKEVWSKLNYASTLGGADHFEALHALSWDAEHEVLPTFLFKKYYTSLQSVNLLPESFDIIYFDAFAPAKQPDMWTFEMLEKVEKAMKSNGVFVTYCAKGQLKRDLRSLGFEVETLPGPPGKKEMTRALKK